MTRGKETAPPLYPVLFVFEVAMEILKYALRYAKAGWKIHPCKLNKHPFLNDWPNKATSDIEQIKEWWAKYPGASIGCVTGEASGFWVLDGDMPDGPAQITAMNLPETLTQETGSGGRQYFFSYNGTDIRNSAKKIASCVDTRGNGGYVILPPSPHESGGTYRWLKEKKIVDAPSWLIEKATKKPDRPASTPLSGETTPYGHAALINEITSLSAAAKGQRNDTLNHSAFLLGQLVEGRELEESVAVNSLMSTALIIGLNMKEAAATISSGMKAGRTQPRSATNTTDTTKQTGKTKSDRLRQNQTDYDSLTKDYDSFSGNFRDAILEFVQENQGSFTNQDIDREYGIVTRSAKKNRSAALIWLEKKNYIVRDRRLAGKWNILTSNAEWIDLENTVTNYFDIDLPLGLSQKVNIPPKSLIIVAGTSNAGKTALLFQILKANIKKDYKRLYMMSEMGPSEYKQRVKKVADDIKEWGSNINAASQSAGFAGTIVQNNRDGLSIIDYLEEVDGEYFRITSDIRSIYDSLNEGVAVIAIQKHSQARVGRGGEGTTEKARLYLTVDTLANLPNSVISAVKIVKAKDYPDENPNGKEIHIEISGRGSEIRIVKGWDYCNIKQREAWIKHYEGMAESGIKIKTYEDTADFLPFKTDTGKIIRIVARDMRKWQEAYPNIDVPEALGKMAVESYEKPFLKEKGYFFQLSNILRSRNDNV